MSLNRHTLRIGIRFLTVFLFTMTTAGILYSCGDAKKDANTSVSKSESPDTIIRLTIHSGIRSFNVKKKTRFDFKDFQTFLNDFSNKPLDFKETQNIDVTGDSIPEQVVTTVSMQGKACMVRARILSGTKALYTDTMTIKEDAAFALFWNQDSVYFKLKPYSDFYLGMCNKSILNDLNPDNVNYEGWMEIFHARQRDLLKQEGLDSLNIEKRISEWDDYKGKLVFRFGMLDRDIRIWDKHKNKFVDFYEP